MSFLVVLYTSQDVAKFEKIFAQTHIRMIVPFRSSTPKLLSRNKNNNNVHGGIALTKQVFKYKILRCASIE